jgi:hypothetical protein
MRMQSPCSYSWLSHAAADSIRARLGAWVSSPPLADEIFSSGGWTNRQIGKF